MESESDALRAELQRYLSDLASRNASVQSSLRDDETYAAFDANDPDYRSITSASSVQSDLKQASDDLQSETVLTNEELDAMDHQIDSMDEQIARLEASLALTASETPREAPSSSSLDHTFFTEIDHSQESSPSSADQQLPQIEMLRHDLSKEINRMKSAMSVSKNLDFRGYLTALLSPSEVSHSLSRPSCPHCLARSRRDYLPTWSTWYPPKISIRSTKSSAKCGALRCGSSPPSGSPRSIRCSSCSNRRRWP